MASTAGDRRALHADLKPYPRMKDSGVEWLGQTPSHWTAQRLRNVVQVRFSNVDKHSRESECAVRLCNYTDVYHNDTIRGDMDFMKATATPFEIARFGLAEGDVLITKDSESWGDIGVPALVESAAPDVICGYHLAVLRPVAGRLTGKFLNQALSCSSVAGQFRVRANGVTRFGLSQASVKSVVLPVPPLQEQSAIASFLGRANARVERLIRAKEKLIALLEEQQQAMIHEAVTGQVDVRTGRPYSAYKPSGTDWLGELPAHWSMVRNGRVFVQRNEFGHPELPILEVSLRSGVHVRNFENMSRKQVMSDRSMYKRAAKGDIAYNMMRMWQGAVGVAPTDGLVSPAYVVARPLAGVESRYFDNLFRTKAYMTEVDKYSRGIVKDRNRLYWEDFKRVPSPCPPANEQAAIADAVDSQKANTSAWIRSLRSQIALVRQYGNRLVADTVMGKLDVRQTSPDLHEQTTRDWTGVSGRGSPPVGTPSDTALEPNP